jgi:hypothetical protein
MALDRDRSGFIRPIYSSDTMTDGAGRMADRSAVSHCEPIVTLAPARGFGHSLAETQLIVSKILNSRRRNWGIQYD